MVRRIIGIARGECTKMMRHRLFYILIALAALLPFSFPLLHSFETKLEVIGSTSQESIVSEISGQEALCCSASRTLMVLIPLLLIYASLSMTSETENRTLKTLLVRPIRRIDLLAGKLLVLWLFTLLLIVIVVFASLSVSAMFFDWYDRIEELNPEIIEEKIRTLKTLMIWMFPLVFFALVAFVTMAFSISTIAKGSGTAVGLTMTIFILGPLLLIFSTAEILEKVKPFILNSYTSRPIDLALKAGEGYFTVKVRPDDYFFAVVVPAAYILFFGALSVGFFFRRRIATS
ncbi:MAG: hypothetical protein E3J72_16535 [Planctomycetota bacterium]|nr:MAG: hypothetical protein E3J72_16535 [Planctomycetota bacterium]